MTGHASLLADASEPGRSTAFIVLLGFVLSFLFIRMSARMIRAEVSCGRGIWDHGEPPPNAKPKNPSGFGVGCGPTLDEFALWVHLKDVYWSHEGRRSLDAVALTAAFMALVVIGTEPLGLGSADTAPLVVYAVIQALVLSVISSLKGRIGLGVLAIFVPLFGLWAAFRLAKPGSPWARRFYDESKLERSRERFPPDRRGAGFRTAFFDAIGGRPSQP